MTTGRGADAAYYLENSGGGAAYYLGGSTSGEPAGYWQGRGAGDFGLDGEVAADDMKDLYDTLLDPRADSWREGAAGLDGEAPTDEARKGREGGARLGAPPKKYRDAEEMVRDRVAQLGRGALPEDVTRIRAEVYRHAQGARNSMDMTFSPVKSVTVLHVSFHRAELEAAREGREEDRAMWASRRQAVEDAVRAGNDAAMGFVDERASYVRTGRHGSHKGVPSTTGKFEDAKGGLTIASFMQYTSRERDPQLHIQNVILNRVIRKDGSAVALDTTAFARLKDAANGIAQRVMEERLTRDLGLRWLDREDAQGREVAGVERPIMNLFSKRSKNIAPKVAQEVARLEERQGGPANALQVDRIKRRISMATRKAKHHHEEETLEERLDRQDRELQDELGEGLTRTAERFRDLEKPEGVGDWSSESAKRQAVAAVADVRAAWSRADLIGQLLQRMPANLGLVDGATVRQAAEGLADEALEPGAGLAVQVSGYESIEVPAQLRRADGSSPFMRPDSALYAETGHMVAEEALRRGAVVGGRLAVDVAQARTLLNRLEEQGRGLGPDQEGAVFGMLTSGAAMSVLIGPAGTGKSYAAAGAFSSAWEEATGGRVIGLAVSQKATTVLRDDGVTIAMNTSVWIDAQAKLAERPAWSNHPSVEQHRVTDRDVLLVDEASMVTTEELTTITRVAEEAGARVILAGDPRQLAAVGAGGMFSVIGSDTAAVYELTEVRRFANEWENAASLRLRDGDRAVVHEYAKHGRVLDAGTADEGVDQVARAVVGDKLRGRPAVGVAATNDLADAISSRVRDGLIGAGLVEEDGVLLGRDGNYAGEGDMVACRRNEYTVGVVNRELYEVTARHEDGSLTVARVDTGEEVVLPADYVAEDVALGYAGTGHAVQGMTLKGGASHTLVTEQTDRAGAYVGLTRGEEANIAHVVTVGVNAEGQRGDREDAAAVLERLIEREDDDQNKAAVMIREEHAQSESSAGTLHHRFTEQARWATRLRMGGHLDQMCSEGLLSEEDRGRLGADRGTEHLSRLLRAAELAGEDPEAVLRQAVTERDFEGAVSLAQTLSHRITTRHDVFMPAAAAADVPGGLLEHEALYLGQLAEAMQDRRRELGADVAAAEQTPRWATEAFGPVPEDVMARQEWEARAGQVALHREVSGWEDGDRPLGARPGYTNPEAAATWSRAWDALGRPESHAAEAGLSEGRLRNRVDAWSREQAWAPEYVDGRLEEVSAAADRAAQEAAIAAAEGRAGEAEELQAEADAATAVRDSLEVVEEERAGWVAHSLQTREAAGRAARELEARGLPENGDEADRVTVAQWLAQHAAAVKGQDARTQLAEHELHDPEAEQDAAARGAVRGPTLQESLTADEPVAQAGALEEAKDRPSQADAEGMVQVARVAAAKLADRRSQDSTRKAEPPEYVPAAAATRDVNARDADERSSAGYGM